MSSRLVLVRSLALAAAVVLGGVSTALAQGEPVTPQKQIPMTKEQPPAPPDTTTPAETTVVPAPPPAQPEAPADTAQQAPPDTTRQASPDTTQQAPPETQQAPPPAAPAETTATTTEPTTGPAAGVWYIGLGGGATFPISSTSDAYDRGWNAFIPIGWQQVNGPFGVRLAAAYNRLGGKTFGSGTSLVTLTDAKIWSGSIDAVVRMHVSPRPDDAIYLLGGGGVFHFTDFATTTNPTTGSQTKFGLEGGLGLEVGLGTWASLFLEGRYTYVWTDVTRTQFIPVTIGLKFF